MTHKNNQESHNFWVGFVAGTVGATLMTYALGTKKGRNALGQIVKHAENFENGSEDVIDHLNSLYQTVIKEMTSEFQPTNSSENTDQNPLISIIDKVKQITLPHKKGK